MYWLAIIYLFFNTYKSIQLGSIPIRHLNSSRMEMGVDMGRNEENESIEEGERRFNEIESYLEQVQNLVVEQHGARNYRWIKSVDRHFDGIRRIVNRSGQHTRIPRTWTDLNEVNMYLP